MEKNVIKMSVDVNVNLSFSESTKNFLSSLAALVGSTRYSCCESSFEEQKPVEEQKPANVIDIESLRRELAVKVNEHRQVIKIKLTELGAPSITKLDPAKYLEMYNFLKAL